ncbi:MAG: hypothetical protein NVS9B7_04280 [Flavisolibacter sp.]
MVVLTGLAGRTHTENLSGKERRFLLTDVKMTRLGLVDNFASLSPPQLDFISPSKQISIRHLLYRETAAQNILWQLVSKSLHQPTITAKKGVYYSDDQVKNWIKYEMGKNNYLYPNTLKFYSVQGAYKNFNKINNSILRYIRTATGNFRQNSIKTTAGNLNIYQTLMVIEGYGRQCLKEISEIKSEPGFPK